jgi:hypothetical protein
MLDKTENSYAIVKTLRSLCPSVFAVFRHPIGMPRFFSSHEDQNSGFQSQMT